MSETKNKKWIALKLRFCTSHILSVAAFSFSFAYLLSFLFEGQVLYGIIEKFGAQAKIYVLSAIISHFVGLFSCGFFICSQRLIKFILIGGLALCLLFTLPFFFAPSVFWLVGMVLAGFFSGCAVAAWGYYLKTLTPKNERLKFCADVLIFSNIIMIAINVAAGRGFPFIGLILAMICLVVGAALTWFLPVDTVHPTSRDDGNKLTVNMKKPMFILFLFVSIITVNSGLMYQVINPAFGHLIGLVSWYWAIPYIVALAFIRNFPLKSRRPLFLYVGIGMIMTAFIAFMLLGRNAVDYVIVDTLMLGACGIFDLFWWSILGEMLEYTERPVKIFGIGLSANVFGVLCGGVLGMLMTSANLSDAEVTVLALTVVCVTLVILPLLNRQLMILLKSHVYLTAYDRMDEMQQETIIHHTNMIFTLTERELEVLQLMLAGKSNKEIADALFVSVNTVKTHAHNIYSKYDVGSRVELISTLLKNQTGS